MVQASRHRRGTRLFPISCMQLSYDDFRVAEAADKYSFVALSLGLEWKGAVPAEEAGSTKL